MAHVDVPSPPSVSFIASNSVETSRRNLLFNIGLHARGLHRVFLPTR